MGESSIASLVGCELLSDVHQLCSEGDKNEDEATEEDSSGGCVGQLSAYLGRERGWRCLAVLQLLGIRELSCGRELTSLLLALYPLLNPDDLPPSESSNPYFSFRTYEDALDKFEISLCVGDAKNKKKRKSQGELQRSVWGDSRWHFQFCQFRSGYFNFKF